MPKNKPLPSQLYLKQCFDYKPRLGVLVWRARPLSHFNSARAQAIFNGRFAGTVAGQVRARDVKVSVDAVNYMAHRIIWMWVYGEDPGELEIDHRNNDPLDNRRSNLRKATVNQNRQNALKRSDNTSGVKGVRRNGREGTRCWIAEITVDGRMKYLGAFYSEAEATSAVRAARRSLHKEFANNG